MCWSYGLKRQARLRSRVNNNVLFRSCAELIQARICVLFGSLAHEGSGVVHGLVSVIDGGWDGDGDETTPSSSPDGREEI